MECPNCGEIISENVKFCRFCGISLASNIFSNNKQKSNVDFIEDKYSSFKTQLKNISNQIIEKATPVINSFRSKTHSTIDSWVKRLNNDEPMKIGSFNVLSNNNRRNLANSLQNLANSLDSSTGDVKWDKEEIDEWESNLEIRLEGENCLVCFQPLKAGERISICPFCGYGAHENHMEDWLNIKQSCPLCRESIKTESLITKNI